MRRGKQQRLGGRPGGNSASATAATGGGSGGGTSLASTSEIPVGGGKVFSAEKVVVTQQIDGSAIPRLVSETLAAQSGHIDAVSGATYTSEATSGPCRAPSTRPTASCSLLATLTTGRR